MNRSALVRVHIADVNDPHAKELGILPEDREFYLNTDSLVGCYRATVTPPITEYDMPVTHVVLHGGSYLLVDEWPWQIENLMLGRPA